MRTCECGVPMRRASVRRATCESCGDRGAQVSLRIVPELGDERVLIERSLDQGTLYATATPVNQPDFAEVQPHARARRDS